MKTIQQAFSQANTNIADEGMNSTGLAWYIDAAQWVLENIARDCPAWTKEAWFYISADQPDSDSPPVTLNIAATQYVEPDVITVPDYVTNSFAPRPVAAHTIPILPVELRQKNIIVPASFGIRHILRVTRNNYECQEYIYPSVQANLDGNRPFPYNDVTLTDLAYGTRIRSDDSLEILFGLPFLQGEWVYLLYTTQKPISFTTVNATDSVPDWIYPALEQGLRWKLFERFFERGNDAMKIRMDNAKANYEKLKYDVVQYSRNLIDQSSPIVIEPMKWLSDTKTIYY